MNIEELLNETMSLLREALMNQTNIISDIEKEVARLRTEIENSKDDMNQAKTNSLSIARMESDITFMKEKLAGVARSHQNLSLTVAKKLGELGLIVAIVLFLAQQFWKG